MSNDLPLDGIRVLEMGGNFAGPFAGLILLSMGAEVVKLEEPGSGDPVRALPPFGPDGISTAFAAINQGKLSVAVDLKAPAERDRFSNSLGTFDVIIESFRPGKADGLGVGWAAARAANPRVIYCSISAFGEVGERGAEPGYDAMIQAYSGMMDLTGYPGMPPARVGTSVIDFGTGMWAALNALGGLESARKSGHGRRIPVAMVETAAAFMIHHLASVRRANAAPTRTGTAQHNMAPYELFTTMDGSVMIAAPSQGLWERLCAVLGIGELTTDQRFLTPADRVQHRPALVDAIESVTRSLLSAHLDQQLRDAGIPSSVVRSVSDFARDPQLAALSFWGSPDGGLTELPLLPLRPSPTRPRPGVVPALGANTDEILGSPTGS